jgi:hypothetical protein
MMKNKYFYSTVVLVGIAFASFSQITITKTDMLSAADTIRMSQASTIGIPDPTLTGANYTWNYDSLKPTLQFVDTFVAVSATPFLYQLYFNNGLSPKYKASFAQKAPNINAFSAITLTNTYNYFQNNASGYSIVGFGSTINGAPLSVKYDSVDVIYKYPVDYGNKDSVISKYVVQIPTIGYFGQRKKRVNEIEGWGTVQTPYGTFNALKVKSTLYVTDTIYYTALSFGLNLPLPKTYEYKWLAVGEKVPVLEIDAGATGAVTKVVYRDSMRAGVMHVGINETNNNNKFSIYPNPASDNMSLSYTVFKAGAVRLDLLDVYGRIVRTVIDERVQA